MGELAMEKKIRNLGALLVGFWLSFLPVTLAATDSKYSDSTLTVVLLVLLLIVICVALIVAWKTLIHTEGGEGYHPQELWGRAQEFMQNAKTRWNSGKQEEDSTEEDDAEEDDDEEEIEPKEEETDITAL